MDCVVEHFIDAMARAGMVTDDPIIADGKLHRIHVEGHRRGTRNGAVVLHDDGHPAGWFMDFVTGVTGTWRADGGTWRMDDATRRMIETEKAKRQAEQAERHAKAAAEADRIWQRAAPPYNSHPYLIRRLVQAHGIRVGTWRKWILGDQGQWTRLDLPNCLLIPLLTPEGKLANLQAILPEPHPLLGRDKDFLPCGRKAGCSFTIGADTSTVLIAEGYATAATLHEHTGHQAVVAFDCGNLKPVALAIRKARPDTKIIVCADNDCQKPGNPGVAHGREAALACGGWLSIPQFPEGVPGSDWNDWYSATDRFTSSLKKSDFGISPLGTSSDGGAA